MPREKRKAHTRLFPLFYSVYEIQAKVVEPNVDQ
jgi:hypothetical protein